MAIRLPDPVICWAELIADLGDRGISQAEISRRLHIPKTTINSWVRTSREPCWRDGDALIRLHLEVLVSGR